MGDNRTGLIKIIYIFLSIILWIGLIPSHSGAQVRTLEESVSLALSHSPLLKAHTYNLEAIQHDIKETRALFFPSIDIELGYGTERHSDTDTREDDADPDNHLWDDRTDASISLTQKLFDKETARKISIKKASMASANFRLQNANQSIILSAVNAHLRVYLQRKLIALATKDLQIHEDILQALTEVEKAGAGNMTDVTQIEARIAQVQSRLIMSKGDLSLAISNYKSVIGETPGDLAFASIPEILPDSLEMAIEWMKQNNPELLSYDASIREAESKLALLRAKYEPKVDLELNGSFYEHADGDSSWKQTESAMVVMRWNLFDGGQNKSAINAALSRKYEIRSNRDAALLELQEATAEAWTTYLSLKSQKRYYQSAVVSSEKTFDAYLNQFNVSRRSLIDVLNAEKEYFQLAAQLVSISVNQVIASFRILMTIGNLNPPDSLVIPEDPFDISRLSRKITSPVSSNVSMSEDVAPPYIPTESPEQFTSIAKEYLIPISETQSTDAIEPNQPKSIKIGPFLRKQELEEAIRILNEYGFDFEQTTGIGVVEVTRLLEGVYPRDKAFKRFKVVKQSIESAFIMPEDGKLAIYVASYHHRSAALRRLEQLAKKQIQVTAVTMEVTKQGKILVVHQVDSQHIDKIVEQMSRMRLSVKVVHSI